MSREIKRAIEVEVTPNPYELAAAFWWMNEHEQATFFYHLGVISGGRLPFQLQAVSKSRNLCDTGRATMQMIGEYGEQAN